MQLANAGIFRNKSICKYNCLGSEFPSDRTNSPDAKIMNMLSHNALYGKDALFQGATTECTDARVHNKCCISAPPWPSPTIPVGIAGILLTNVTNISAASFFADEARKLPRYLDFGQSVSRAVGAGVR